jgi:hypothetical protein
VAHVCRKVWNVAAAGDLDEFMEILKAGWSEQDRAAWEEAEMAVAVAEVSPKLKRDMPTKLRAELREAWGVEDRLQWKRNALRRLLDHSRKAAEAAQAPVTDPGAVTAQGSLGRGHPAAAEVVRSNTPPVYGPAFRLPGFAWAEFDSLLAKWPDLAPSMRLRSRRQSPGRGPGNGPIHPLGGGAAGTKEIRRGAAVGRQPREAPSAAAGANTAAPQTGVLAQANAPNNWSRVSFFR